MKILKKTIIIAVLLCSLLLADVVSAAAEYKTIPTNSSWDVSNRTVNGAVFTSSYNNSTSGNTIRVTKNGKTKTITNYAGSTEVITDGSTVYYSRKNAGGVYLYKMSIASGKNTKIGKLGSDTSLTLAGKYKNDIYYINSMPEGQFAKKNLTTKKVKTYTLSGKRVSRSTQKGKYFILADGTGAGFSYLGVFDASKPSFKKVSVRPLSWNQNTKYLYYVEKVDNDFYTNHKVKVKRYCFATGEKKTLVSSLTMQYATKITSKYVKYVDVNGNTKTKKFAG